MFIGILYIEMHIPASTNLKAKRRVLQSIKAGVLNKYVVSISEVGYHDLWQRAALGVAAVGPDHAPIERELNAILDMIHDNHELAVTGHNLEIEHRGGAEQ